MPVRNALLIFVGFFKLLVLLCSVMQKWKKSMN